MNPALIVMYHYVRPDNSQIPAGIRPLLSSEFEQQLDWLSERFKIVTADEFLQRFTVAHTDKPACLLTFDDGTKDHADVVTPILASRGLSGVFFVLSGPAEHGTMPLTHAIHWLLGGEDSATWDLFQNHAGQPLGDPKEAQRIYHYETPIRAQIKYAANMVLPFEMTERIVRAAVQAAGKTMEQLAREWFVSADDIQLMDSAGMTIASHGITHRSLQSLGPIGIKREIDHCSSYLKNLLGKLPVWYACPFGGSGAPLASLKAMRNAMTEVGVVASVSTEKAFVFPDADRLALPRIDAIDLPPRRADLMRSVGV